MKTNGLNLRNFDERWGFLGDVEKDKWMLIPEGATTMKSHWGGRPGYVGDEVIFINSPR